MTILRYKMVHRILLIIKPSRKSRSFTSFRSLMDSKSDPELSKIRNIGILAHIDAGKTTTTERMLYYSGKIKNVGEVDKGTTVTDYMEQERNRGITITSACVTFDWTRHQINLVDTPGHIDFTVEVEQAINVMDSAVIVLDATAGVQVQTVTVWKQADRRSLPRLVYVNKMDRPDSDLFLCQCSLKEKLGVTPLVLQIPIKDNSGFHSLIDTVSLRKLTWLKDGLLSCELEKSDELYTLALEERFKLIDRLSGFDDSLANIVLETGSFEAVSEQRIKESVRRTTLARMAVPVICGSSFKNIGIEPLMHAIIDYLPSPLDAIDNEMYKLFNGDFIAKSFKVMHDKQKGPLVFLRVYSGQFSKGQKVYNLHSGKSDQVGSLFKAFADELTEVPSCISGSLIAATGLKTVSTGNLICSSSSAGKRLDEMAKKSDNAMKLLQQNIVPKPVFFCSIEPPSQTYQVRLERALEELCREDPSLTVTYDEEGQTILGGMGELHLEIIKERLKTEYKIDADMGPLQIVYKETPLGNAKASHSLRTVIGSIEQNINITLSLKKGKKADVLLLDMSKESSQNLAHLSPRKLALIKHGVNSALNKGPLLSCEVIDTHFLLHWLEINRRVPEPVLIAAASQCVNKLLKSAGTRLLEPIMQVNISIDDAYNTLVIGDLSRRRADITNILSKGPNKDISSQVPLSELLGYAKHLRTITSGSATFTMEFSSYKEMLPRDQDKITKETYR